MQTPLPTSESNPKPPGEADVTALGQLCVSRWSIEQGYRSGPSKAESCPRSGSGVRSSPTHRESVSKSRVRARLLEKPIGKLLRMILDEVFQWPGCDVAERFRVRSQIDELKNYRPRNLSELWVNDERVGEPIRRPITGAFLKSQPLRSRSSSLSLRVFEVLRDECVEVWVSFESIKSVIPRQSRWRASYPARRSLLIGPRRASWCPSSCDNAFMIRPSSSIESLERGASG